MNVKVHIPEHLEQRLLWAASRQRKSPTTFIETLVETQLRGPVPSRSSFSPEFRALAGSWEDDRTADEIIQDIQESRSSKPAPELR